MIELISIVSCLILSLAVIYALVSVVGHYYSLGLIFPRPPVSYALDADYLQLTTPDGFKLAARHWQNPGAKYTVLYLHGNYEDLGSVGEYMPPFIATGYAVFAVDYRRYGRSEGVPTETNVYADTRQAYHYLREELNVPADRIIIFGYSLGAGPAIELARHEPAAGLIIQGAFISAYRVMTKVSVFVGDKFVNLRKVPELKLPVYVIHGTSDLTVPFWHGEALYAAINAPKKKFFVEGGPHSGLENYVGPRYWEELRAFTDSL